MPLRVRLSRRIPSPRRPASARLVCVRRVSSTPQREEQLVVLAPRAWPAGADPRPAAGRPPRIAAGRGTLARSSSAEQPDRSNTWSRSASSPSEMSMQAPTPDIRASARPARSRGVGTARTLPRPAAARATSSATPPSVPVTKIRSPEPRGTAQQRAATRFTEPWAVIVTEVCRARLRLPPISGQPWVSASSSKPASRPSKIRISRSRRGGEGEHETQRPRTHRGEVREVCDQRAAADAARALGAPAKVDTLDERVGGDHPILTGRGSQYRPIVADSDDQPAGSTDRAGSTGRAGWTGHARATRGALDALDQAELAEVPKLHGSQRSQQMQKKWALQ